MAFSLCLEKENYSFEMFSSLLPSSQIDPNIKGILLKLVSNLHMGANHAFATYVLCQLNYKSKPGAEIFTLEFSLHSSNFLNQT